jgi:ribonuclease VapC
VEAYTVIFARKSLAGVKELELLCDRVALMPKSFETSMIAIAKDAWMRYGKTSGHPARLNFGDCFAYALAKHRSDSLLCKGDDFSHTDIRLVDY